MTNIIILAAGQGKRFKDAGYTEPKPSILINDTPMLIHAAKSIGAKGRYIFITQKEHGLRSDILTNFEEPVIMELINYTSGAAVTALLALDYINNDDDLFIVNCDQILKYDFQKFMSIASASDGALGLFPAGDGDRWSFAKVENGRVVQVKEKERISDQALVGLHYWKRGSDFVKYVSKMTSDKAMVNGEYYISPAYQYAIDDGKTIVPFVVDEFWEIGTPESLKAYKDMVEC